MPGSRGEAHLVMKCKFCRRDLSLGKRQWSERAGRPRRARGREGERAMRGRHWRGCSVWSARRCDPSRPRSHFLLVRRGPDILEDKVAGTLTSETPGFQPVATLDVRGLELVDFKPGVSSGLPAGPIAGADAHGRPSSCPFGGGG